MCDSGLGTRLADAHIDKPEPRAQAGSMLNFLKTQGVAFEPETIDVMVRAFDIAWAIVEQTVPLDGSPDAKGILRNRVAQNILSSATNGERDPDRMAKFAVRYLARGPTQ
jgi:hypothetical protein